VLAWTACVVAAALPGAAQQRGPAIAGTTSKSVVTTTEHLSLTATLAGATIAPGGRVALSVSVRPKPGIHVYAPGSHYRAVAIALAARSGFRLEAPVTYPTPVPYVFKPLNETVPVYDAPFRLIAQLGLDPSTPAAAVAPTRNEIALDTTLDYQACDDRVCYLPESIPLRFTITRLPTPTPRP
jgi:DsbC/DsbD-like thiol-disulfide interchange protein